MGADLIMPLGAFFIGAAAIAAVIVYLGRLALRHVLAGEIATYKQQLQMEGMLALERLKSELRRNAYDHEVRVSKLQDRRAEVIAELYKRIVFLRNAMTKITGQAPAESSAGGDKVEAAILAGE